MNEVSTKIDQVTKLGIAAYMKQNGFKKKGRGWQKETPNGWLLVHIKASNYNTVELVQFAVSLGIYNTEIESIAQRHFYKENQVPRASGSTLFCQLNHLGDDRFDWDEILPDTDLHKIANEIVEQMISDGMPWLLENDNVASISSKINQELIGRGAIAAAIVSGDREEARRRFRKTIECRPHSADATKKWAIAQELDLF